MNRHKLFENKSLLEAGNYQLSATQKRRQREVLQLLAEGLLMKEIADALDVTTDTVSYHKYTITERLRLRTTADLVQYPVEHVIIERAD